MNKTIYLFWIGDDIVKKKIINHWSKLLNKTDWRIEIGPTKDEHYFFMKNSSFYKKSFENKIYAFCSDFYRVYKIKENGGLYIDAGCKYNKNKIVNFLKEVEKKECVVVLERPYYLWNGFFWFRSKSNKTLNEICEHLNKIYNRNFDHIETGPIIFSHFFFKNYGYNLEKNNNIMIMKSYEFDNKNKSNIFYMNPSASWWNKVNRKINDERKYHNSWEVSYKSFTKNHTFIKVFIMRIIFSNILLARLFTYRIINKMYYIFFK